MRGEDLWTLALLIGVHNSDSRVKEYADTTIGLRLHCLRTTWVGLSSILRTLDRAAWFDTEYDSNYSMFE